MTTEEADEVVGELDLILSQPPSQTNVHVLQYPLRHPTIPTGTEREILGAAQRPRTGRLELKVAVHPPRVDANQNSTSFDEAQDDAYAKEIGSTQVLRSRPHRSAPHSNFVVGRYDPSHSAFVLVPVASFSQLRPSFDYLDAFDMKMLQARLAEKGRSDTRTEPAEGVSAVQMSFRRRETERAAERRKNSHATLRMMEEGEPWQQLTYSAKEDGSPRVESLFTRSVSVVKDEDSKSFVDSTDYEALFHLHTRDVALGNVAKGALDMDRFSINALRAMSVSDAVTQIFDYARVLQLGDICSLLPNADERDILKCIRVTAICVRGCWVMKNIRHEKNIPRTAIERYGASRFLIYDLFRRSRVVRTIEAHEALGEAMLISEGGVETILKEVSELKSGVGWIFRLDDDEEFQNKHPELIAMQERDWEKRVAAAREAIARSVRANKRNK